MQKVNKPWGHEEWLELNDKYCYKKIHFNAGSKCSLQYHDHKTETIYVMKGKGFLEIDTTHGLTSNNIKTYRLKGSAFRGQLSVEVFVVPIKAGDSFTILPGQVHRVVADTDLVTLETSTPEVDDCVRLVDDNNRPHGRIEEEHVA